MSCGTGQLDREMTVERARELEANILWALWLFLSLKYMEVSEEFKKERKRVQFQTNILNQVN